MQLSREEVMEIIPHRDPMLLIDEVIDLEPEKNIHATFYIEPQREIFKGHFPGDPVLPGIYTVEIMAQASDILLLVCERYKGKTPYFLGIDKVRFSKMILPGDAVEVHSHIESERVEKAIVTCKAEVYKCGELACCGELTIAMR